MKTELKQYPVRDIVEGFEYNELEGKGLFGLSGRRVLFACVDRGSNGRHGPHTATGRCRRRRDRYRLLGRLYGLWRL